MNVKNVEIRNLYQMYPDFKIDVEAADFYQEGEHNDFTIEELLKPLEQTINLAGMRFNKALVSHDMVYIPDACNNKEEVEQRASCCNL